jgi:hypothetical protein
VLDDGKRAGKGGGVMDNLINFPSASNRGKTTNRPIARTYCSMPDDEYEYVPRSRRFAKNPLRRQVTILSVAIVEANKLDECIDGDSLRWIREGVEAARILALELGRLAERLGGAVR